MAARLMVSGADGSENAGFIAPALFIGFGTVCLYCHPTRCLNGSSSYLSSPRLNAWANASRRHSPPCIMLAASQGCASICTANSVRGKPHWRAPRSSRLGVSGRIRSPTYTLVEHYALELLSPVSNTLDTLDIYHFDLYRFT